MKSTLFSPAKINLFLHIVNQRENGMHNIHSAFLKLNFGDILTFEDKKEGIEICASGKYKVPTNAENLVYQAAFLMRERAKGKKGIRIHIEKNIPLGAGLGGGSSNAATTLLFLNNHWNLEYSVEELQKIGVKLGSDIPFFLQNNSNLAEVSGIGEIITPLKNETLFNLENKNIVLCIPKNIHISTPWAYSQLINYFQGNYPQNQKINSNIFEEVLFPIFPDLLRIKNIFLENGAQQALMTGSGSVVFGIFEQDVCLNNLKNTLENSGNIIITKVLENTKNEN